MGNYGSEVIQCPFYMRHDSQTCHLTCESMPPGSSIKSHFSDGKAMRGQIRKYCAGDWKLCPWAKLLLRCKYEEE